MSKISHDVAVADFEKFLTAFRLDPIKKRKISLVNPDTGLSIIDPIIELIEEGMLIVKDNGELEYILLEPLINSEKVPTHEKITFKPKRVTVEQLKAIEKIDSDTDKFGKILNILSGISELLVDKFSTDDISYCSRITTVFM